MILDEVAFKLYQITKLDLCPEINVALRNEYEIKKTGTRGR